MTSPKHTGASRPVRQSFLLHRSSFIVLVALIAAIISLHAADWPRWRGPDFNSISKETGWTDKWPADGPPVLWKASVGTGFSCFAVAGGRVFTMGNKANTDTIWCLDAATGKELWKHSYESDLGDKFFDGGPGATPTVDGDRVFALSRWGDLFCFDAATGKIHWSKNVQKETQIRIPDWGFAGSPLVHENFLVLNIGAAGLALDKLNGKILWQSADERAGYSSPVPLRRGGELLVLVSSGDAFAAVNLRTGAPVWNIKWLTEYGVNAAEPIVSGDNVLICTGENKGAGLFKLGAGALEQVWKTKSLRTHINPGVLLGGHVYGMDGNVAGRDATLKCIEFATGKQLWSQPGTGAGAVVAADGKLIVLSERGELMVAPATPEGFKPTSRAQVLGGRCWTSPVLANGRIYCRNSRGDVVCLDVRSQKN